MVHTKRKDESNGGDASQKDRAVCEFKSLTYSLASMLEIGILLSVLVCHGKRCEVNECRHVAGWLCENELAREIFGVSIHSQENFRCAHSHTLT